MDKDTVGNVQTALNAVKGKRFWRQGSEARFSYAIMPLPACTGVKDIHGVGFQTTVGSIKEGFCTWFHCLDGFRELSEYYLDRLRKEDVIAAVEREWKPVREELLSYCEKIVDTNLAEESLQTLTTMLKKIGQLDQKNWYPVIFIDSFDPRGEDIIEESIREHAPDLREHMTLLMTTDTFSYVQKEEMELSEIAKAAEKGEDIEERLTEHQRKFFWYNNSFAHPAIMDITHFRERLANVGDIDATLQEKKRQIGKRDRLLQDAPEELGRLLRFFQWMTDLRDRRKEVNCIKMSAMRLIFEALSEKTSLPVDILENIFYDEVDLLEDDPNGYAEELKRRQKHGLMISLEDTKPLTLSGNDADMVREELEHESAYTDEIYGKCACKGIVNGRVKIVRKLTDFEKFKEGDILVTAMTRPEHMPLIKKAAAIVTDEGGVTCHAAIVSRELGKPCVIGTQSATDMLNDGDLIEVHADEGIVKIMERSNG